MQIKLKIHNKFSSKNFKSTKFLKESLIFLSLINNILFKFSLKILILAYSLFVIGKKVNAFNKFRIHYVKK